MSSYWMPVNGCLKFKKEDSEKMKEILQKEAVQTKWDVYGWADNVRNAESLEDILDEMEIKYSSNNDIIELNVGDTYYSAFLKPALRLIAPYLLDSEITIRNSDDNYNTTIIIKDHKAETKTG